MSNGGGKRERGLFDQALAGERTPHPPIWLMRQAGRYLPEYREIRAKAPSFLDFCYNPALATEATLQPIRRFGFDAAIVFSDILVVPHALGQDVSFESGEGPRLKPITTAADLSELQEEIDLERLGAVFETIERVRGGLPGSTPLLGFCGAPWTITSYMVAGQGTSDQRPARLLAYRDPGLFEIIIERIVRSSIRYLLRQFEAGADAVQIFDSWAGVLPAAEFERWCAAPVQKIIDGVRRQKPDARVILFSRVASSHLAALARTSSADAIGLDTAVDPAWAAAHVQTKKPVQGNLDPLCLVAGGPSLDRAVRDRLRAFGEGAFIFNLGHGILPETPIENVERLLRLARTGD